MKKICPPHPAQRHVAIASQAALLCGVGLQAMCGGLAAAAELQTGQPGLRLVWDTTLKYSAAFRVQKPSSTLLDSPAAANQDDGDRNFDRGLISSRLDLYSEADLTYQNFGARLSAAGWYDTVYNRHTPNTSVATANHPAGQFPPGTRDAAGRKAELLDAFVSARGTLGDVALSGRAGRHSLQWGETLFFANNGMAGTMAPVDAVKAALVPNSLVREIIRPVGQVSGQAQLTPDLLVGAYVQYKWEKSRIPASGSFFSGADFFDDGGETLILGPGLAVPRMKDIRPKDSGQFGLQLKLRDSTHGIDYGAYATQYHAKALTTAYVNLGVLPSPPFPPGTVAPVGYSLAYAQNIRAFGLSASFTSGDFQWAGEVSTRHNTPLYGDSLPVAPLAVGDNDSQPGYAVGKTAHVNLSMVANLPSNLLARSATMLAEVAWNRTLSISRNPQLVFPTTTRDAWALRVVYSPTYTQVLEGVDLEVPIGLGYSPKGSSSAVPNFGVTRGGDFSVGMKGTYESAWTFGLNYSHFFGKEANGQEFSNGPGTPLAPTFKQSLKDRDFLSFSLSTTF